MLTPIPLEVLKDTVIHAPLVQGSRGKTYAPEETLERVLVQNKMTRTTENDMLIITSDALLFFDTVNSIGNPVFKVGDQIKYTDAFGIEKVKYIKQVFEGKERNGNIHHYEVSLL